MQCGSVLITMGEEACTLHSCECFGLSRHGFFPDAKAYAGCRSWVQLPESPAARSIPILDEHENARRRDDFQAIAFDASETHALHEREWGEARARKLLS